MNAGAAQLQSWPLRRWGLIIGLIFLVQIELIFLLGKHAPEPTRAPGAVARLRLAGNGADEMLALNDPTLFALPHPQGFSGPAWLNFKSRQLEAHDWTEPPRWLALSLAPLDLSPDLGSETNEFDPVQLLVQSAPELTLPAPPAPPLAREHSAFRLEGRLARRRLLRAPELTSWRHTEILTNSIVQVSVDGEGRPMSVTLLSGSGLKAADDHALAQAAAARFESIRGQRPGRSANALADISVGEMIFEWHTLPPTNAP